MQLYMTCRTISHLVQHNTGWDFGFTKIHGIKYTDRVLKWGWEIFPCLIIPKLLFPRSFLLLQAREAGNMCKHLTNFKHKEQSKLIHMRKYYTHTSSSHNYDANIFLCFNLQNAHMLQCYNKYTPSKNNKLTEQDRKSANLRFCTKHKIWSTRLL